MDEWNRRVPDPALESARSEIERLKAELRERESEIERVSRQVKTIRKHLQCEKAIFERWGGWGWRVQSQAMQTALDKLEAAGKDR